MAAFLIDSIVLCMCVYWLWMVESKETKLRLPGEILGGHVTGQRVTNLKRDRRRYDKGCVTAAVADGGTRSD